MRAIFLATISIAMLAAPAAADNHGNTDAKASVSVNTDKLSSTIFSEKRTGRKFAVQVLLDRAGFSPGVIDGYGGGNTDAAIRAYRKANDMPAGVKIDADLIASLKSDAGGKYLQRVTIKASDLEGGFDDIPDGMEAQAKMDRLGYSSPEEMLAERYHMDVDFLKAMNPNADFSKAGTNIIVAKAGPSKLNTKVARVQISRSDNWLRAYDGDDNMIAAYPATVGSAEMPSPSGDMTVRAVAPQAKYYFDPEANPNWGPKTKLTLAAGPNNPVGGVWIDLSKETYGIHGSPDPSLIGKTASHGCVRLTNWDARELADAVSQGTKVEFVG